MLLFQGVEKALSREQAKDEGIGPVGIFASSFLMPKRQWISKEGHGVKVLFDYMLTQPLDIKRVREVVK